MYQFTNPAFNKETIIEEDNGNQLQYSNINDASLFDDNNEGKNKILCAISSTTGTESSASSIIIPSTSKLADEQTTEIVSNANIIDETEPSNIKLNDYIKSADNKSASSNEKQVTSENVALIEEQATNGLNIKAIEENNKISCDNENGKNEDNREENNEEEDNREEDNMEEDYRQEYNMEEDNDDEGNRNENVRDGGGGNGDDSEIEDSTDADEDDEDEGEGTMSSEEEELSDDEVVNEDPDDQDSQFSNFTGFSGLSSENGSYSPKPLNWVQKQIHNGELNDMALWKILSSVLSEQPKRSKLTSVNTLSDVVQLLKDSKNIMVLTGAGVSVSCGIPDFRSSDGIYSRLAKDYPNLPDPQSMFDIYHFSKDPRPFYKFAREIYPGQFTPSPCHRFIKLLEKMNKLLRNYTQNIDTLEQVAGIKNIIECHGSFATASCTKCKFKQTADEIRDAIFAQTIPLCPQCQPNQKNVPIEAKVANTNDTTGSTNTATDEPNKTDTEEINFKELVQNGIMKPDIVFFGEGLPDAFHTTMANDKEKCDLLIVVGSSLKVRPVALIPNSLPAHIPQILINRERLNHLEFDVELLGDSDEIINQICHMLGEEWSEATWKPEILTESLEIKPLQILEYVSHNIELMDQEMKRVNNLAKFNETSSSTNSSAACSNGVCESGYENSNSTSIMVAFDLEDFHKQRQQILSSRQQHLNSVDSSKDSGIQCEATTSYNDTRPNIVNPAKNIGNRLYENTYFRYAKNMYVFPGAQVCYNTNGPNDEDIINNNIDKANQDELIFLSVKDFNILRDKLGPPAPPKPLTIEQILARRLGLRKRQVDKYIAENGVDKQFDLNPLPPLKRSK